MTATECVKQHGITARTEAQAEEMTETEHVRQLGLHARTEVQAAEMTETEQEAARKARIVEVILMEQMRKAVWESHGDALAPEQRRRFELVARKWDEEQLEAVQQAQARVDVEI